VRLPRGLTARRRAAPPGLPRARRGGDRARRHGPRRQIALRRDKAEVWIFVAGGAFLIAIKETWELHETNAWPEVVFWALVVVMSVICIVNAAGRARPRRAGPLGSA
jgi:hypothetical protein